MDLGLRKRANPYSGRGGVQSDARTLVLRTVYTTVRKPFRYVASTDIEAEPGGGEGREKRAGGLDDIVN